VIVPGAIGAPSAPSESFQRPPRDPHEVRGGRGGRDSHEDRGRYEGRYESGSEGRSGGHRRGGFVPAPVSRDPFFSKPYEPATETASAQWEAAPKAAARGISANIKPRRKTAALFKIPLPVPVTQALAMAAPEFDDAQGAPTTHEAAESAN
jgi:hypothetical protein